MFSSRKVPPETPQAIEKVVPPREGIESPELCAIKFLRNEMQITDDEAYRNECRECIRELREYDQLVVARIPSNELPEDDARKLEQENLRALRLTDESTESTSAQQLIDFIQDELDASATNSLRNFPYHRKTWTKCLRVIGKHHKIVPTSFFCRNLQRDGFCVAGGASSDIYKGTMVEKPVCLKVLRLSSHGSAKEKGLKDFCHEALVWGQLRHGNVLPFLGFTKSLFAPSFCLISPWMENGNIISFLRRHPSHDRLNAVCEIAQGIRYLHELAPQIVHGDIKGASILVNNELCCCLANFDLSLVADSQTLASSEVVARGPLRWLPPEMMDDSLFDHSLVTAADIYSFGCTIIEIYTGKVPFAHIKSDMAIIHEVMMENKPPQPLLDELPSNELWTLVESCLSWSAKDRPNALTVLQRLREMKGLCPSCPDDYSGPCLCLRVGSTPSAIIVNEPLVGSSTLRQPSSTSDARNLVPSNNHSPDSFTAFNTSRRSLSVSANRLQAEEPRSPSAAGGSTPPPRSDKIAPIPASEPVPTLSAQPLFPVHVREHLFDHQERIYSIFERKVGLSADHLLLTAAFDEKSLRSDNGSLAGDKLAQCAHIFCDTDLVVEDSTDVLAKLLLDVQNEVLPHSVIIQTPNCKFRICSVQPDSASGTSSVVVSFSRSTSTNTCPDRSRDPDDDPENPENRAPTDTPRLPDPNQSLAVGNAASNSETPTASSGRPDATPEADPGPPMESMEDSHRAVFKIAFKFNKGNPLPFEQSVLISGSIGTKDTPNSPVLPDVVSSSRVEFFELDFQSTSGGAQEPNLRYHQFRSSVDIQIAKDHPILLSDKRPLASQSSVDGQVKAVEATEGTQAMQLGGTLTLGTQPAVTFTGMSTTTDKSARTNEYVRTLMRVQQVEINRRGIEWRYEIGDEELQVGGLKLTPTPALLPLVQFAFCGKQGALSAPTQLDVTVRSFWKHPPRFCPNSRTEDFILWLSGKERKGKLLGSVLSGKRKREIPIQNFGLDVRLKLPTHLTRGSFINKDVIIESDRVDSSRMTQSVTDFYSAGDLVVTPLAYTR